MTDEERYRQEYLQQPVLKDPPLAPMLLHRERARRYDEYLANLRIAEMRAMHNHTNPQYELDIAKRKAGCLCGILLCLLLLLCF